MAHTKKLDKGPHEAGTSLSCALRTVLVIVYKNDPLPILRNILRTQKSGPVDINKKVFLSLNVMQNFTRMRKVQLMLELSKLLLTYVTAMNLTQLMKWDEPLCKSIGCE